MEQVVATRLDAEDSALLDAVVKVEKLTKSDCMRRALRQYARQLGVDQPKPRRAKR